jgi:hypothetical protein
VGAQRALAAVSKKSGAKAHFQEMNLLRWNEVQLPLLKQGAPTKLCVVGLRILPGAHAGAEALIFLPPLRHD